jgi:hypothetical protein
MINLAWTFFQIPCMQMAGTYTSSIFSRSLNLRHHKWWRRSGDGWYGAAQEDGRGDKREMQLERCGHVDFASVGGSGGLHSSVM